MKKRLLISLSFLLVAISLTMVACGQMVGPEEAAISGRVYRADNGEPIAGAKVLVYGPHGSTGPIQATTSSDGSYTVIGLGAGESTVGVEADGYVPEIYDGADGVYDGNKAIKVITVYGKNTSNIDFYLGWGGAISGHVYLPDNVTPVNGAYINYQQLNGEMTPRFGGCLPSPMYDFVRSDSGGSYTIGGLLSGDYDLWVRARIGDKVYYSTNNLIIAVVTGNRTDGIDFLLEPGGSISGHIYESDGITSVGGRHVSANHQDGLWTSSDETADGGSYFIEQIPAGVYQIEGKTIIVSSGQNTVHDIILAD